MIVSHHFDDDPLTAQSRIFHFDYETDRVIMESQQDITDLVEVNKAEFNLHDERTPYNEMHKVASIPMPVMMELHRKGILEDEKAFRKWLDDPDNKVFRTRPGRLSK